MSSKHIPNYTLCCSFGDLELFRDLAETAENLKPMNMHQLLAHIAAKRLKVKFKQKLAEEKLEYKMSLQSIDALTFYQLVLGYKNFAKGKWQTDLIQKTLDDMRVHFNPYLNKD